MAINVKKKLKKASNRSFLARDFESLRSQLIQHARIFFPDKIQDFSESSVGGLLVDVAASVGDSLSYYLDHEFRELDPMLAVEPSNIMTHLKNAGVKMYGASPASVILKFSFEAPAELVVGGYRPKVTTLPTILQGTISQAFNGVTFTTVKDLNFAELDVNGNLICDYTVKEINETTGTPTLYTVSRSVTAVSGLQKTTTFLIADTHVPFREITLSDANVTDVLSVSDSDEEPYYEVTALSQDTVFTPVQRTGNDWQAVSHNLEITPAPRRFVKTFNPVTRFTTLRFGAGDADTLDDDILPDPSELSLELYGKKTFARFTIDPNSLLNTQSLGISPKGTTLTVKYRYGGGLNHNVSTNSINDIITLQIEFRESPSPTDALTVRQTLAVTNLSPAAGGANPPTIEDLRQLIGTARQSQGRMVTREDLLARIYTMPAQFGSVYRASITSNPVNPLSALLYIISLDKDGNLTISPDALKKNLSNYLNEFRLISDAIDILDAQVTNFGIKYSVTVTESTNKIKIIQNINNKLSDALQKKYFQIDQPIVIDDITNVIINTDSVISLSDLKVFPRIGVVEKRNYSSSTFPFERSTKRGIIFGPRGSIFEMKFPKHDIIGSAR